jgi:HlyD family type I secretion membrane fusion protein
MGPFATALPGSAAPSRPPLRGPAVFGLSTGIAFVLAFGVWASVAEMESAAVASGTILVEGNRKTVQHLEGGIVGELAVREGAVVKAGEVILRLDDTLARTAVDQLRGQLRATIAQEARLIAERDERPEISFPTEMTSVANDPSVAEMMAAQQRIFTSRRDSVDSQTRILRQRTVQAEEQIAGLQAQVRSQDRQDALIREEIVAVETLVNQGLEKKPRLLLLQRTMAENEGKRGQNLAEIARVRQSIGENELRIHDLRTTVLTEAVKTLRDEQTKIYELRERLRAAEDVLARQFVRAPVSGKVVGLKVFTVGGVIQPREPLMEIVPAEDALIVEVQVTPADIDTVRIGLPVRLTFSAFNHWSTPVIDGTVIDVSGDRLTDQRTGANYYTARIAANAEQLAENKLELRPGMPVDAQIVTGQRTLMEYLLRPVTDLMRRSLREE